MELRASGEPARFLLLVALAVAAVALAPGCGDESRGQPDSLAPRAPGATAAGERAPAPNAATRPAPDPKLVAALGDSITAGSPLWDPDPEVRANIGGALDPESQFELWAEAHSGGARRFRNCGVYGERTDEIALRLDPCTRGVGTVILQGGINDIVQMRRVTTAAQNLQAMTQTARRRGLRVLIAEVLPWNNGYPLAAGRIARLNRRIAAIGEQQHVEILPFYRTLVDPRRPGRMKREWTIDGDHPSVEGYRRLGELIARRLQR